MIKTFAARHCQTEWSAVRRLQGSTDLPLSESGVQQAKEAAPGLQALDLSRIVASPLLRAAQTGRIYADYLRVPLLLDDRLRELDHGTWEGRTWADLLSDRSSGFGRWLADPSAVGIPDGIETVHGAQDRFCAALADVTRGSGNALLVSHKHILALARCRLQNLSLSEFQLAVVEDILPREMSICTS